MFDTRKILSLGTYFLLATGAAALVRLGIIDPFNGEANGFIGALLNNVVFVGWTPAFAAFLVWRVFGSSARQSSWMGKSNRASWLIAIIPGIALGAYGIPNELGLRPRAFGFLVGALIYIYALGEEIGWRGFMHDALAPKAIWVRAAIITLPWYMWHLPFFGGEFDIIVAVKGLGIVALAAFFLSLVSEESRSWMIVAGFHSIGNIGFMGSAVDLPSIERLILAGVSFAVMLIIYNWQKPKFKKASQTL